VLKSERLKWVKIERLNQERKNERLAKWKRKNWADKKSKKRGLKRVEKVRS